MATQSQLAPCNIELLKIGLRKTFTWTEIFVYLNILWGRQPKGIAVDNRKGNLTRALKKLSKVGVIRIVDGAYVPVLGDEVRQQIWLLPLLNQRLTIPEKVVLCLTEGLTFGWKSSTYLCQLSAWIGIGRTTLKDILGSLKQFGFVTRGGRYGKLLVARNSAYSMACAALELKRGVGFLAAQTDLPAAQSDPRTAQADPPAAQTDHNVSPSAPPSPLAPLRETDEGVKVKAEQSEGRPLTELELQYIPAAKSTSKWIPPKGISVSEQYHGDRTLILTETFFRSRRDSKGNAPDRELWFAKLAAGLRSKYEDCYRDMSLREFFAFVYEFKMETTYTINRLLASSIIGCLAEKTMAQVHYLEGYRRDQWPWMVYESEVRGIFSAKEIKKVMDWVFPPTDSVSL